MQDAGLQGGAPPSETVLRSYVQLTAGDTTTSRAFWRLPWSTGSSERWQRPGLAMASFTRPLLQPSTAFVPAPSGSGVPAEGVSMGTCATHPLPSGGQRLTEERAPALPTLAWQPRPPLLGFLPCTFGEGVVRQGPSAGFVLCLHHHHHVETVAGVVLLLQVAKGMVGVWGGGKERGEEEPLSRLGPKRQQEPPGAVQQGLSRQLLGRLDASRALFTPFQKESLRQALAVPSSGARARPVSSSTAALLVISIY